jgi:hypothetical protein
LGTASQPLTAALSSRHSVRRRFSLIAWFLRGSALP